MTALERITTENAALYKAVRLNALKESPTSFGSTYARESRFSDEDWINRAANLMTPRSVGYLAIDEGEPCGIAASFLDEHDPQKAQLVSMWVAPTHRRTGVGRALIDAIQTWARSTGARHLQLMVTSINLGAIEFYRRIGFSMTGKTEPYPHDPAVIEYEMSQPLA